MKYRSSSSDSECEDDEDDDVLYDDIHMEEKWIQVNYEFRIAHSDISTDIILCSNKEQGFFGSHTKLSRDKFSGGLDDQIYSGFGKIYLPSISIVNGYLKNIDTQSRKARKLQLNHKFSIAFNTYNPELGEMFFDVKMYHLLFKQWIALIAFDEIEVTYGVEKLRFQNFDALTEQIKKWNQIENGPIDELYLLQDNNVVLYIETEYYTATGGPAPYSDTYNFAMYSKIPFVNMEVLLMKLCKENNIRILYNLSGSERLESTFLYKIKRFFLS